VTHSYDRCLSELRRRALAPAAPKAVFVAGSLVRNWGNANSDLDVYVICEHEWRSPSAGHLFVAVRPSTVATEVTYVRHRRWDIQYWTDAQIDRLVKKVSWQEFDRNPAAEVLPWRELELLERIGYAVAVEGQDWLEKRRLEIANSALRSIVITDALAVVDLLIEDALGQLHSGDAESAILSARKAFGYAVDALLASYDQIARGDKWRARRFRLAEPQELSFQEYWEIETMQTLQPDDPGRWVDQVVQICRRIRAKVDI
jgi:hypothetical protein